MAQILAFPSSPRPVPQGRTERPSVYDKRKIDLYARLLDEEAAGSSEEAMAREVLHLNPRHGRARAILRGHLRRAHWVADTLSPLLDW